MHRRSLVLIKLLFSHALLLVTTFCLPLASVVLSFFKILTDMYHEKIQKPNNKGTVIERSEYSANWQTFLKTQNVSKVASKKTNAKSNKEINFYPKPYRSDQKSLKKHNDFLNKNMSSNILESVQGSENANFVKQKVKDGTSIYKKNNIKRDITNVNINNVKSSPVLTKFIAMDCEMVGIGEDARDNMLARVSLVNKFGDCVYDKFVQPRERVTDYRTPVSGVRKEDVENGEKFEVVQRDVAEILKGRYLVGHALKNDIEVLFLSHPTYKIRDTSRYQLFRTIVKGGTPSLKKLTKELLGVDIQSGEHSSVEDARAAMQLYCLHSRQWEDTLARKRKLSRK